MHLPIDENCDPSLFHPSEIISRRITVRELRLQADGQRVTVHQMDLVKAPHGPVIGRTASRASSLQDPVPCVRRQDRLSQKVKVYSSYSGEPLIFPYLVPLAVKSSR